MNEGELQVLLLAPGDTQAMKDGILVRFPADFSGVGHGKSDCITGWKMLQ